MKRFMVFAQRKTDKGTEVVAKEIPARTADEAVEEAEKSFERTLGKDWQYMVKIQRVQELEKRWR